MAELKFSMTFLLSFKSKSQDLIILLNILIWFSLLMQLAWLFVLLYPECKFFELLKNIRSLFLTDSITNGVLKLLTDLVESFSKPFSLFELL